MPEQGSEHPEPAVVSVAGFSELRLQGSRGSLLRSCYVVSVAGFSELRLQDREITLF